MPCGRRVLLAAALAVLLACSAWQSAAADGAVVGRGSGGAVTLALCTDRFLMSDTGGKFPCRSPLARIPNNTAVATPCWLDDRPMINKPFEPRYPLRSPRWFYAITPQGTSGWVHSHFVTVQDAVPACTDPQFRGYLVANWAGKHRWSTYATAADNALLGQLGATDWAGGIGAPWGEWSGDCWRFSFLAWAANGKVPDHRGTAMAVGSAYAAQGRLQGGAPPPGAIVFYAGARNFGHAAISVGGGLMVSTMGFDHARKPNLLIQYTSTRKVGGGPYRGWTTAP